MSAPATDGVRRPSTDGAGRSSLDPTRVFLRPLGTPVAIGAVIVTGCARLAVTGLYEINNADGLREAAAIIGMVLAAVCAYGIVALLTEDLPRRSLLPVLRSGRAATSFGGGLADQLADLEHEAGVRRQL